MQAEIKLLSSGDEALLASYDADAFDDEITPELLKAYLAAPLHKMAIAIVDGVAVGQARAVLHFQPDAAVQLYIDNLGVGDGFKRQGLATRMIQALLDWGRQSGATSMWVATETDNGEGVGFYNSLDLTGEEMLFFETEL